MTLLAVFHLQREREREPKFSLFQIPFLECHGHGSSHRVEDFGCMTPLEYLDTFFTITKLIQEHPNSSMSLKSQDLYSKMVLKPLFFITLYLEIPRDRYMHSKRSRTWEQSNLRFLTLNHFGQVASTSIVTTQVDRRNMSSIVSVKVLDLILWSPR